MKVALHTLGCKLNQAETELLARSLTDAGFELVYGRENVDIYVLNTCSVTAEADRKARQLMRAAKRRYPNALVVVMGCYAQRDKEVLLDILDIDIVLDNTEKMSLPQLLKEKGFKGSVSPLSSKSNTLRNRSFIKIQNGCDAFCTYCIVPYLRPVENCLPSNEIIDQIQQRIEEGYKEVVLTGTEIDRYRSDGRDLAGLVSYILTETGIERLRLSSIQPQYINQKLLALFKDRRLCCHFHLSLQSGTDSVLKRMGRRYDTATYSRAVKEIRRHLSDVAITTDIIIGFPGETAQEFEENYTFCYKMNFSRIHTFSFSARPGTLAAVMTAQVDSKVKKERMGKMLELAGNSARAFKENFLGKKMTVLWEGKVADYFNGYTSNYIKVYLKSERNLTNTITEVTLKELHKDGVMGSE